MNKQSKITAFFIAFVIMFTSMPIHTLFAEDSNNSPPVETSIENNQETKDKFGSDTTNETSKENLGNNKEESVQESVKETLVESMEETVSESIKETKKEEIQNNSEVNNYSNKDNKDLLPEKTSSGNNHNDKLNYSNYKFVPIKPKYKEKATTKYNLSFNIKINESINKGDYITFEHSLALVKENAFKNLYLKDGTLVARASYDYSKQEVRYTFSENVKKGIGTVLEINEEFSINPKLLTQKANLSLVNSILNKEETSNILVYGPNEKHNIILSKTDENKNPISGAKFSIYENDKKLFEKVTDDKGQAIFGILIPGKYKIKEESVPERYQSNNETWDIFVAENGAVNVVASNEAIKKEEVTAITEKDLSKLLKIEETKDNSKFNEGKSLNLRSKISILDWEAGLVNLITEINPKEVSIDSDTEFELKVNNLILDKSYISIYEKTNIKGEYRNITDRFEIEHKKDEKSETIKFNLKKNDINEKSLLVKTYAKVENKEEKSLDIDLISKLKNLDEEISVENSNKTTFETDKAINDDININSVSTLSEDLKDHSKYDASGSEDVTGEVPLDSTEKGNLEEELINSLNNQSQSLITKRSLSRSITRSLSFESGFAKSMSLMANNAPMATALAYTGVNVNDRVTISNMTMNSSGIDPNIVNITSAEHIVFTGNYAVADSVLPGDYFTINYGSQVRPGALNYPPVISPLYSNDGQIIANGTYNTTNNTVTYIFTSYIDTKTNVTGSFKINLTEIRESHKGDNTAVSFNINAAGESFTRSNMTFKYGYAPNGFAQLNTNKIYIENGKVYYDSFAYFTPAPSQSIKTITLTTTGISDNQIEFYSFPRTATFKDNFLVDSDSSGALISTNGNVGTKLTYTKDSAGNYVFSNVPAGYKIISKIKSTDDGTTTPVKITVEQNIADKAYGSARSYAAASISLQGTADSSLGLGVNKVNFTVKKVDESKNAISSPAEFVLYDSIKDSNGKDIPYHEIARLTTGTNGLATFTGLQQGTKYYVFESSAPDGYIKTNKGYKIQIPQIYDGSPNTNLYLLMDEVIKNPDGTYTETPLNWYYNNTQFEVINEPYKYKIHKVDENGKPLSGVIFNLYKRGVTAPVQTGLTTDSNGDLVITKLSKGTYDLFEVKSKDGYLVPIKPITFSIGVDLSVPNVPGQDVSSLIKFNLMDWGTDKGSKVPVVYPNQAGNLYLENKYTLPTDGSVKAGDYFTVKLSKNIDLMGITAGSKSRVDLIGPYGTLAEGTYDKATNTITYKFTNYIDLYKPTEATARLSAFIDRYKTLENNNIQVYETLGSATQSFNVKVDYTYSWQGIGDAYVGAMITQVDSSTHTFTQYIYVNPVFLNQIYNANLIIYPQTPRPGASGVKFDDTTVKDLKIWYVDNSTVIPSSFGVNESLLGNPGYVYNKYIQSDGSIRLDFNNGTFYYQNPAYAAVIKLTGTYDPSVGDIETRAAFYADGSSFFWDSYVEVRPSTSKTDGQAVTEVKNRPNWIEFQKVDGDSEEKKILPGAEFDLRKLDANGIVQSTGQKVTSDSNGLFRWEKIAPGKYEIWETKAPVTIEKDANGNTIVYTLPSGPVITFEVDAQGYVANVKNLLTNVDDYVIPNYRKKTNKITFNKTGYDRAQEKDVNLQGAVFELRKEVSTGKYVKLEGFDKTSNPDGTFTYENLPAGNYEVWEISTPQGYKKPTEAVAKFSVNETTGQIEKITPENKIIRNLVMTSLDIIKKDANKDKSGNDVFLQGATFKLFKTADETKELITFEEFNKLTDTEKEKYLYKNNGISEFTTDAKGKVTINGLTDGTYWLQETKAPSSYLKLQGYVGPIVIKNGIAKYTQKQSDPVKIVYDKNTGNNTATIINKKAVYPATGGIGTSIFIYVGLSLMSAGYVLMKISDSRKKSFRV